MPDTDAERVRQRQCRVAEAQQALASGVHPWPLDDIHDLRPHLTRAAVAGAHLEPAELQQVAATLQACARMRRFLDAHADALPLLLAAAAGLQAHTQLAAALRRAVLESGELADAASPELGRIRRRLAAQRDTVLRRLEAHLGRERGDAYVTMRGERYVIPVRADAGGVRGIVHDRSASGGTLFVEPLDVVDANNELQALRDAEQREIRRILQELTARLAAEADSVARSLQGLEQADALHAAARFGASLQAASPRAGAALRLRAARHPLLALALQARGQSVVPLDLDLGAARALVITGPNTGGKTVALKTVGMAVLMHQSGLPVLAHPDSELPIFQRLVADIGDEQSIEAAESTFSSHLRHVRAAVESAGPASLALLDEFMAGTDPEEGTALAKVSLRWLVPRQATTLVTTHLGALKLFAHGEPGVANAAMVFDATSGAPLFRLQAGVPGSSNALATAARLGFAPTLVEAARRERGETAARLEEILRNLEAEREALQAARLAAEAAEAEARRLREEAALQLADLTRRRAAHLSQARREVETLVAEARARVESTIRALREAQASRAAIQSAHADIEAIDTTLAATEPAAPDAAFSSLPPVPGDTVWIRPLGREGQLERLLDDEHALVRYGAAAITVPLAELEKRAAAPAPPPRRGGSDVQPATPAAALELDLRGKERAEALQALDAFLDRALLQGLGSVLVVHGKGTGALRKAVQEHLATHPSVASFRLGAHGEGGSGVTIVELH